MNKWREIQNTSNHDHSTCSIERSCKNDSETLKNRPVVNSESDSFGIVADRFAACIVGNAALVVGESGLVALRVDRDIGPQRRP